MREGFYDVYIQSVTSDRRSDGGSKVTATLFCKETNQEMYYVAYITDKTAPFIFDVLEKAGIVYDDDERVFKYDSSVKCRCKVVTETWTKNGKEYSETKVKWVLHPDFDKKRQAQKDAMAIVSEFYRKAKKLPAKAKAEAESNKADNLPF